MSYGIQHKQKRGCKYIFNILQPTILTKVVIGLRDKKGSCIQKKRDEQKTVKSTLKITESIEYILTKVLF